MTPSPASLLPQRSPTSSQGALCPPLAAAVSVFTAAFTAAAVLSLCSQESAAESAQPRGHAYRPHDFHPTSPLAP